MTAMLTTEAPSERTERGPNLDAFSREVPALLRHHLAMLCDDSGIDCDVIRERGYRSITRPRDLEEYGFTRAQRRCPGLLLPLHAPDGSTPLCVYRPDQPRLDAKGKPRKYELPKGSRVRLDVPPRCRAALGDPAVPLWITEGQRKADAAASHGLCCIALLGVWSWRGTNAHGGKTASPDWEYVALKGRDVYIAFDSDVMQKPAVAKALRRLCAFLASRGAIVHTIYLPSGADGAKTGLDDYLRTHAVAELLELAKGQAKTPPQTPAKESTPPSAALAAARGAGDDEVEIGGLRYRATERGLMRVTERLDRESGQIEETTTALANFAAWIHRDVVEDDGAEQHRYVEGRALLDETVVPFRVLAAQLDTLQWVPEQLGPTAVIYPGQGAASHVRAAVRLLSRPTRADVYAHLGWRQVGGHWVYLHAGGAIGATGPLAGVDVRPPEALARYTLPTPPAGAERVRAIRASLTMLHVGPRRVTVPLLAGVYRAVLGPVDFSMGLVGPTTSGKSELAALAQQHYGAAMDSRHLPADWLSTGNALERLAFAAKDALLVVDDWVPSGTRQDVERSQRDAARLYRAQGNQSGRARARTDGSVLAARPPRGLILTTGEDVPRGESVRGRVFWLELPGKGLASVDRDALTAAQTAAAAGHSAQALAAFVQWVAADHAAITTTARQQAHAWRKAAAAVTVHPRTADTMAQLAMGYDALLTFARTAGAITEAECAALWAEGWAALGDAAQAQSHQQHAADPAPRFLELLSSALTSGRAHVADSHGLAPPTAEAWGWRKVARGGGAYAYLDYEPHGQRVGWLTDDALYLDPDAAYGVARTVADAVGDPLGVSPHTLRKRLHEGGHLVRVDDTRSTLTVRHHLQGVRRNVLHLAHESLAPGGASTDQPDHSDPDRVAEPPGAGGQSWSTRPPDQPPNQQIWRDHAQDGAMVSLVNVSGRREAGKADAVQQSPRASRVAPPKTDQLPDQPSPKTDHCLTASHADDAAEPSGSELVALLHGDDAARDGEYI